MSDNNDRKNETNSQSDGGVTRRQFIKTAGQLTVAGGLVGAGLINPAALFASVHPPRKVRVGIFGPSHCAAPFVITKLKGYFGRDYEVSLINYPEAPLIAKDLIAGKLDFGQLIVPLAMAIHTGSKPFSTRTPVVISQIGGTNGAALMVAKGAGIKTPADFKGKSISNHSKLSVHYLINMMFLEKYGLNQEKDVKFRVIELENILQEAKGGTIDSFIMPEPKNSLAEVNGYADVFMLSKYIWPNHPCCALVAKKSYFDENRELATSVVRSFTRGGLWANDANNREAAVDLLRSVDDYMYDKIPKKVLINAFTPGRSDFFPFPYQSSARVILEIMKKNGLLIESVDERRVAQEVFLSDLSRKVFKELGAAAPKNNYRPEKILGTLKQFKG